MRWLLLLSVLAVGSLWGGEVPAPNVREKLKARIIETLPPPPPAGPAETKPESEGPVLVLAPIVVTESRGVKELAKALADDRQRQEAERFTVAKGGTLYRSDRVDLGIWWAPGSGWELLRIKW